MKILRAAPSPAFWQDAEVIRDELFGLERLEEHARTLAAAQPVTDRPPRVGSLASRLDDNAVVLLDAYRRTVSALAEGRTITPASEWLVDNYHLVERRVREIDRDLPPGFHRQLPKLASGPFAGYPRVFGLAWAFVAHTDSRFDADMLVKYLRAYQSVEPLTIGELWAVSIALRMVLIENLRRLAAQTLINRDARQHADMIADQLLAGDDAIEDASARAMKTLSDHPLPPAMVVQLLHRLRDQDPDTIPMLAWLDRRLISRGTTADDVVNDVHRRQGATNVTVRNIITSLRRIGDVDWKELFERASPVDDLLASVADYPRMDFATRNLYRSAIEDMSRCSGRSELDITRQVLAAAQTQDAAADPRCRDPGYHLLARGRPAFERHIGYRPRWVQRPARFARSMGLGLYVGSIFLIAGLMLLTVFHLLAETGVGVPALLMLGLASFIPIFDVAMAMFNRVLSLGIGATALPGMALTEGVPADLRTLVAVPTLLTTPGAVAEQVAQLEVHHLASPDGDLLFALLSDWTDAATEQTEADDILLKAARDGIARLNARYGPAPGGPRFLLLHRRRVWCPGEGCWMGWERKRGKLHELNRLLRGATDTGFLEMEGAVVPVGVRYVLTLDADTRLPRDAARRLIGKMAHPLNRPRFDPGEGRVVEGYGLLQPRITPSLPVGRQGSLFQRIFSSLNGIDPYAAAISDHYQDLFGEGSYAGKGIYDIDAFELALAGRVPDGTVLSHDLFEGNFARAALVTDVELVEDFPTRYELDALRHHRWARGDWQLLPWLMGRGYAATDPSRVNGVVPAVGRWKMLDNLRRTLVAPLMILSLVLGWTLPFAASLVWTLFNMVLLSAPPLFRIVTALWPTQTGMRHSSHLRSLVTEARQALLLAALTAGFLAHQAWMLMDAVLRTLWRLWVSHRHLLQWVPAAQTAIAPRLSRVGSFKRMAGAPVLALGGFAVALAAGGGNWLLCLPFTLPWLLSPFIAERISRPSQDEELEDLGPEPTTTLRLTARRTWRYFERFVTTDDNMLPPDNFQETPVPVLARRTSPTNIGLYLLSVVAARDFGWIGTQDALDRLEATIASMDRLERFRGHFLNWYATADLRPLDPKYVSSVDSGNLAGHLIALANSCDAWRAGLCPDVTRVQGVADALSLVRDIRPTSGQSEAGGRLDQALDTLARVIRQQSRDGDPDTIMSNLTKRAEQIASLMTAPALASMGTDAAYWAGACIDCIHSHDRDEQYDDTLGPRLAMLAHRARALVAAMDFTFLYDSERQLLSIGHLLNENVPDPSCYDLLASEARLASFIAIAKGDIPARHWFRLGRTVVPANHHAALVSWSGSMFEYLMPALVMRAPGGSLLERTSRLIVHRQIVHAARLCVPWGMSESAYNARDLDLTYQYSNFGVPSLGLKRGLAADTVIAPYATMLAAMVDPSAAARNLHRLLLMGARGHYGYYEALDFTPARLPKGQGMALVQAYMAHHQGMGIVAIANTLLNGFMRARFHAEPMVRATELLLQERMPAEVPVTHHWAAGPDARSTGPASEPLANRHFTHPYQATPATLLLSNGRMTTMLTAAGAGQIRRGTIALTRWREDPTCDSYGTGIFLRDLDDGRLWSATQHPCGVDPDSYDVTFHEDRAEFVRHDGSLVTGLDILISAEDDAEVRRVTLTNEGPHARHLDVTSYLELALCPQAADVAHPAFAKLFVQTEHLPGCDALIATRRRRSPDEAEIWLGHMVVVEGNDGGVSSFETDRARFLGRGRSLRDAVAMEPAQNLSGTTGTVLDPVFALRQTIRLTPQGTARLAFWTLAADSRAALLDMIDRHRDVTAYTRAATLAWTQAQVQQRHLGIGAGTAALFQQLAGHLVHATPALRPASAIIQNGLAPQSDLWPLGISGDLPILLVRITDSDDLSVVREGLLAFDYWRMKRFAVDLIILNDHPASYLQELQTALETLVRVNRSRQPMGHDATPGGVYLLRADLITPQAQALLNAVARVVLVARRGSLFDQLQRLGTDAPPPVLIPKRRGSAVLAPSTQVKPDLEFFNGLGGFARNASEYVITQGSGQATPAPWINVIANPDFGFQVSADGNGFCWAGNSRENQLTPWSNDPVTDPTGDAFYLRDEESGALWSPTPSPIRDPGGHYIARHGWGYSRFTHRANGISSDLLLYVPVDAPVRIARLTLHNTTHRPRSLTATAYVEWVLGPSRDVTRAFVSTSIDAATGAMFARNPWNRDVGGHVAFADLCGRQTDWTGDRREFIGRNGTLAHPLALAGMGPLSKRVGAGLDPCGVLRTRIDLPPDGRVEIVFLLGQAESADAARTLVTRYREADLDSIMAAVSQQWRQILGKVQVTTPDRSLDVMLNGWLLYQTLSCRIWARSAFYQASGAYGFRDQLQDGMALAVTRPDLTRTHLLRAAGRQFVEGDVQHWWLPPSGRGVRTRISDDRVWLAYAAAHYVETTGDLAVLDEKLGFLDGPRLHEGEHDSFFHPSPAEDSATLFEHCARALDASLTMGTHGLPLMGTGDWNDGMNRVGEGGQGESVWLGWLLYTTLMRFADLAQARGDLRAGHWRLEAMALKAALNHDGWDGDWYRRGYFDDGTPLGSALREECRIDAIAQSWSVLSGAGDSDKAARAMQAVETHLVAKREGLALLFTPPFAHSQPDPGYIQAYPAGIRENGGQYTHAALWSVMALAALGRNRQAADLLHMLNPVNHTHDPGAVRRYRLEPYVVAADIYSVAPHVGRGGWGWYTGAAGWMQRAGMEAVLGLRQQGNRLVIDPRLPSDWPEVRIIFRHGTARYDIHIENRDGQSWGHASIHLDGTRLDGVNSLELADDGNTHQVLVRPELATRTQARMEEVI
jgi:cyclic beta-1,2-glucan synthetase